MKMKEDEMSEEMNTTSKFNFFGVELPKIEKSVAIQLKDKLTNIQNKLEKDTFGWTVKI